MKNLRFKTKQELIETWPESWSVKGTGGGVQIKAGSLWGLPYEDSYCIHEHFRTTDPHPFDSMDIKVRVTPKQSKKLQKKAEKMGHSLCNTFHGEGDHWITLYSGGKKSISGTCSNANGPVNDNTELTYKQFMNGSVPKKKKFKVGDWVEVVDDCELGHNLRIGFIGRIDSVSDSRVNWKVCGINVCSDDLKHTTKPKEQPLKYKEWDVKVQPINGTVSIGCKTFCKHDLKSALHVMSEVSPHTDLVHFMQWLINDKTKLGL